MVRVNHAGIKLQFMIEFKTNKIMVIQMRKISYIILGAMVVMPQLVFAAPVDKKFQREVFRGLDYINADAHMDDPDVAPGEMGANVYGVVGAVDSDASDMFIPASMYMRAGGGLNLGFATDAAKYAGKDYDARGGYLTQIGLGWNLSSFVRGEIDFTASTLKFVDLDNHDATYQTAGGMLYFDLARRYVQTGDITHRRRVVPFIGVGAGLGVYEFQGTGGANGMVVTAPRAAAGVNIMLTELIGVDFTYHYSMMIGNGYGWGASNSGTNNVSDFIASFRVNF